VNTDDILPGKYAPFMVGEDRFQTYAFAHLRPEFAAEVQPGDILVGGRNWGLGSSREYAPQALKVLGVGAIVARSFARIHYRNLLNLGIPAFAAPELVDVLQDGDRVRLEMDRGRIARLTADGSEERLELPPVPDFLQEVLSEGSVLAFYKRHGRFPGEARHDPPG
ncbi:MAG: homoaconitate hydratase, partial [Deinococcales bacterium]